MFNSKDMEYMVYTLGDIGVIELLIAFRYKYDESLYHERINPIAVSGAGKVFQEGLVTYSSLNEYIDNCNFTEQQLKLIEMIGDGYTYEEISEKLVIHPTVVKGRLKTIYKRILKENEREWRKSIYFHKLGLKSKVCSKCKEELPATVEFYRDDSRNKDGLQSRCRSCEN